MSSKKNICPHCDGTGKEFCYKCNGKGIRAIYGGDIGVFGIIDMEDNPYSDYKINRKIICRKCNGTREITCKKCKGTGYVN